MDVSDWHGLCVSPCLWIQDKNPIAPILFAQSATLSLLSVLSGQPSLCFLMTGGQYELMSCLCLTISFTSASNGMSVSDTVSWLKLELRRTSLLRSNFPWNCFIPVQTGLKRESDKSKTKHEPAQTTAADLLPNKSHATANVSVLARSQELSLRNCDCIQNLPSFGFSLKEKVPWIKLDCQDWEKQTVVNLWIHFYK